MTEDPTGYPRPNERALGWGWWNAKDDTALWSRSKFIPNEEYMKAGTASRGNGFASVRASCLRVGLQRDDLSRRLPEGVLPAQE